MADKTDLEIKYDLCREYVFEQMMPPGAPFGNRFLTPLPARGPHPDRLPVPACPGSAAWYLGMMAVSGYTNGDLERFTVMFREKAGDTQIVGEEYETSGDSRFAAETLLLRAGKITEQREDTKGAYHVMGYVYLESLVPRNTRYFDRDPYAYICRIPVFCDFTCLPGLLKARFHGLPTGRPDADGHARAGEFPYPVMADANPAYRARELVRELLRDEGAAPEKGETFAELRKREYRAYNLEYTALKGIPSLLLFPAGGIAACFMHGTGNLTGAYHAILACSLGAAALLTATGFLLHGKHKRLISEIQAR